MPEQLLVVGASARAAAQSVRRAGIIPLAIDLFGDADLRQCARTLRIDDYPDEILALSSQLPACPWIYTGALENHAAIIDKLAARRQLLGTPGKSLRLVRNPWSLRKALLEDGLQAPAVCHAEDFRPKASGAEWLRKPIRSAGGTDIQGTRGENVADALQRSDRPARFYMQERVAGEPRSAVFVGSAGAATLVGVTHQLIGLRWCGASGSRYAGSVGPIRTSPTQNETWQRIGDCLVRNFSLEGLFGVDAIVHGDTVVTVEVNPRYTSSVEVLERAGAFSAIRLHVEACRGGRPTTTHRFAERICGKAIVYARSYTRVGRDCESLAGRLNPHPDLEAPWPGIADIPCEGTTLDVGQPVTTVLAEGRSVAGVVHALRHMVVQVQNALGC